VGEHRRRIDKVLDPEFLADLPEWPLDELRRRQAECLEIETEVSYQQRRGLHQVIEPHGGRLGRPAQGGPGVIAALE
jgi:hypothetical protein